MPKDCQCFAVVEVVSLSVQDYPVMIVCSSCIDSDRELNRVGTQAMIQSARGRGCTTVYCVLNCTPLSVENKYIAVTKSDSHRCLPGSYCSKGRSSSC